MNRNAHTTVGVVFAAGQLLLDEAPEDIPVAEIARTLEEHHIKRVPVIRDGQLVGIVSRANLLHGIATRKESPSPPSAATDQAIREDILHTLKDEEWANLSYANVTVEDGVAHLWGMADTDAPPVSEIGPE